MKNFKSKYVLSLFTLASIFVIFLSSCSNDDNSNGNLGSAPVINSVSRAEAGNLTPTTVGYANNMYIIQGSGFSTLEKIYFNDTDTYFNPTLVTDSAVFVTIDQSTPYENASNELTMVTKGGTATYSFVVAPPAPQILRGFNPVNASEGDQVTIYGNFFLDPVVTFGTVQATIVSNTLTEIVAIVPAGAEHQYVTVTTISGDDTWNTAVGTAFYDDAFYAPWDIEAWNNHEYLTNPAAAFQGNKFIHKKINGWDNIQGNWQWDDQISAYTGIKFAVRSDTPGKLVLIFNGSYWGDSSRAFETTTEWKEVSYTWAQLSNADHVQNISFQEFSGEAHDYYFDNFVYTVD